MRFPFASLPDMQTPVETVSKEVTQTVLIRSLLTSLLRVFLSDAY